MRPPSEFILFPALTVLATILFSTCSPLSRNVREEVQIEIPFETMRREPEKFEGKTVILGGHVLEVRNLPQTTEITVLQTPLGFQDRPQSKEQSQGRFIMVYDGFLDPAIYEGRMVTVAGIGRGRETIKVDGYSYPTIAVRPVEIHLWEKEDRRSYPYYDPFYDPFFYDPFYRWHGPYGDPFFWRPWPRRR